MNLPSRAPSTRGPHAPGGICRGIRPARERAAPGRRAATGRARSGNPSRLSGRAADGRHRAGDGDEPSAGLADRPELDSQTAPGGTRSQHRGPGAVRPETLVGLGNQGQRQLGRNRADLHVASPPSGRGGQDKAKHYSRSSEQSTGSAHFRQETCQGAPITSRVLD